MKRSRLKTTFRKKKAKRMRSVLTSRARAEKLFSELKKRKGWVFAEEYNNHYVWKKDLGKAVATVSMVPGTPSEHTYDVELAINTKKQMNVVYGVLGTVPKQSFVPVSYESLGFDDAVANVKELLDNPQKIRVIAKAREMI